MHLLSRYLKVGSTLSALCLLAACGGSGQDDPSGETLNESVLAGQAVDGYVARGLVFIDTNENHQLDSWEARAFTDNEGYFSVNQRTGENYCADDADEVAATYCLKDNMGLQSGVIQIVGGYDLLTEMPFEGRLTARVDIADAVANGVLVTPLTSVLTHADTDAERASLLQRLGLSESDLSINYLDEDIQQNGQEVNGDLLNKAIKLHKVSSVVASLLENTYDDLGEETTLPTDASVAVYESISDVLLSGGQSLDQMFASSDRLEDVVEAAENKVRAYYEEDEDLNVPTPLTGSSGSGVGVENTADLASSLSGFVDSMLTNDADVDDATGGARAVEVVTHKIFQEISQQTSQQISDAIAIFEGGDREELLTLISGDDADLSTLIEIAIDDSQVVRDNGTLSGDAFGDLVGKKLRVADPDEDKTARVEFYFHGAAGASEGSLSACIRYEEIDDNGNLEDDASNTDGKILEGHWSFLNDSRYAVIVMLELLDTPYQAILRASDDGQFRFDYDGDFENWNGENGGLLEQSAGRARTDAECKTLMNY